MSEPTVKRTIPVRGSVANTPAPMEPNAADSLTIITEFKSAASDAMSKKAELELIPFVERQIELMNQKLLFNGDSPTFSQLNTAISQYESVLLGLTSLYEMQRWEYEVAKEEYDEWFAQRFIEVRQIVNPDTKAATKFLSSKEIEYLVMTKFKDERAELLAKKSIAESRKSTVRRLIDAWEAYRWNLMTLSKNAVAEANASGMSIDYDESN